MIIFIIPAFNEEENVELLLSNIDSKMGELNAAYHVILINDGSTDKTVEVINNYMDKIPVTLVDLKNNKGVAEVFRIGFEKVLKESRDSDIIITMDADNTHDPRVIKMMVSKLEDGYEIVNASAFATGGMMIGLSLKRLFFTKACNMLYGILFPIKGVYEYTGFYRGYNAGALKQVYEKFGKRFIESNGFSVMAELLIKFRRMPLFITEAPMILRYDLKGEKTKLKTLPTVVEHLKIIGKNIFQRGIIKGEVSCK